MDPVTKMYMFHHWLEDTNEQVELAKYHGYLIGSFTNPEAVKQMIGGNTISASEEDFEETSKWITEDIKQESHPPKRRRRKRKII